MKLKLSCWIARRTSTKKMWIKVILHARFTQVVQVRKRRRKATWKKLLCNCESFQRAFEFELRETVINQSVSFSPFVVSFFFTSRKLLHLFETFFIKLINSYYPKWFFVKHKNCFILGFIEKNKLNLGILTQ